MKKKHLYSFFILNFVFNLFSQIKVEKIDFNLEHVFSIGEKNNQLFYLNEKIEPSGPVGLIMLENGKLLLADSLNNKIKVFTNDYSIDSVYEFEGKMLYVEEFVQNSNDYLLASSTVINGTRLLKLVENKVINIFNFNDFNFNIDYDDIAYFDLSVRDNFIIGEYSNMTYFSIEIFPENFNKKTIFRDVDKTKEYFNSGKTKFRFDKDGFLYYENDLLIRNSKFIIEYFKKTNSVNYSKKEQRMLSNAYYLGKDNTKNTYWKRGSVIIIFNKNGKLNKFLYIKNNKRRTQLALDLKGNIYFLEYSKDGHKFFKLERTW